MFADPLNNGDVVPDLIFLDLVMQGMDGWEFLDRLRSGNGVLQKTDIYILPAL